MSSAATLMLAAVDRLEGTARTGTADVRDSLYHRPAALSTRDGRCLLPRPMTWDISARPDGGPPMYRNRRSQNFRRGTPGRRRGDRPRRAPSRSRGRHGRRPLLSPHTSVTTAHTVLTCNEVSSVRPSPPSSPAVTADRSGAFPPYSRQGRPCRLDTRHPSTKYMPS